MEYSVTIDRSLPTKIKASCNCGWTASARYDVIGETATVRIDREIATHERKHKQAGNHASVSKTE